MVSLTLLPCVNLTVSRTDLTFHPTLCGIFPVSHTNQSDITIY